MQSINEIWVDFEEMVLVGDISEIQKKEMKLAFFAGAQSMLNMVKQIGDCTGPEDEDAIAAYLMGTEQEVHHFFKQYIA
jgi:hypothetical protein